MKRFKSIALAAFTVVVAAAAVLPADDALASSAALSIVPKKNYTIEQGKSVDDTLTIRNLDAEKPLELSLRVIDFTFTDDGGTPKLLLDPNAPQTTWSLKPYLSVPETVSIPPKTSQTVDMNITIPAGQGAGSYYSAIVYSSGSPDGGNVGLSASGVTLVFTSIPGDVKEDLKLEQFGPYRPASDGQKANYVGFATSEPQMMAYTLKNGGNVVEAPVGSITLRHMFGKEYTINEVNPNSSLALIGQTRTFTSCIQLEDREVEFNGSTSTTKSCVSPGLWPGYYSATVELFYGQNGNLTQEITKTIGFWYMPWWFIIVLVVLLAVIAYVVWRIVQKVRSALYGTKPRKSSRSVRRK